MSDLNTRARIALRGDSVGRVCDARTGAVRSGPATSTADLITMDLDDPATMDLDDPATVGALLAIARLRWGCDNYRRLTIEPAGAGWCVIVRNDRHRPPSRAAPGWVLDPVAHPLRGMPEPFGRNEFATEVEAIIAALEAT